MPPARLDKPTAAAAPARLIGENQPGPLFPFGRVGAAVAACAIVLTIVSAWRQVSFWQDSGTLWTHTLASGPPTAFAQYDLGIVLARGGQPRGDPALQGGPKLRPDGPYLHYALALRLPGAGSSMRRWRTSKPP